MTIGLIDADGHNFPNLALMKLSGYHKRLGDDVRWWNGFEIYDVVYMSKVFDETYSADVPEPVNAKRVVKGGTGYVRRKDGELQYFVNGDWVSWVSAFSGEIAPCIRYDEILPPEIEHTCPDYGLYPQHTADTACGYLTRGCPNNCPFCIVSQKEGLVTHKVAGPVGFGTGRKPSADGRQPARLPGTAESCSDSLPIPIHMWISHRAWIAAGSRMKT